MIPYLCKKHRQATMASMLCLAVLAMVLFFGNPTKTHPKDVETARRILPGYSFVFGDNTNVIERCRGSRAFHRQHEMMDYLEIFAPHMERFNHPTNHPIMIRETEDRVILELPCKVKFPPYNWTIYWGSDYNFRMEIDKKTKRIVNAIQG